MVTINILLIEEIATILYIASMLNEVSEIHTTLLSKSLNHNRRAPLILTKSCNTLVDDNPVPINLVIHDKRAYW